METQDIASKLIEWIESSSDFLKGQWPDFVEQFIRASLLKTWFNTSLFLFAMIIFFLISLWSWKYTWKFEGESWEISSTISMLTIMCPAFFLISLILFSAEIHNLINIYVSPKVFILHHLKDLIK